MLMVLCLNRIMTEQHESKVTLDPGDSDTEFVLGSEVVLGIYKKQWEQFAEGNVTFTC
jgi:hypothetical protein